jgi:AcrR family transcriptional regulator
VSDDRSGGRAPREAEALRRDREKAARAAARATEKAEQDRTKVARAREKDLQATARQARGAEREVARAQAERDRAAVEAEREASRAQRDAARAALDAGVAQRRADRHLARALLEARRADDVGVAADADEAVLPTDLELLWRRPAAPRRGPRPGLTLEGIADAAIRLADDEGFGAVSMARVAEALGVTTMALYRYVGSKDDLLALMYDIAIGRPPQPPGGDEGWRPRLEQWASDQLALVREHPWIMDGAVTPRLGPNRVAWIEAGLQALEDTPLDHGLRTAVMGTVALHVLSEGRVLAEVLRQSRAADSGDLDPSHAPAHPALVDYGSILRRLTTPEEQPAIADALAAGGFDQEAPGDDETSFGLRLLMDGIEALMTAHR